MAKHRQRNRSGLKRRVAAREPKRTFLVLCEGERTEPDYLEALKVLKEVQEVAEVDVRIDTTHSGNAPLALVQAAVQEVDEVWCLFDVEAPQPHRNLDQACALALKNDVHTAISNPCFEIWLVLHFKPHTQWLTTADAVKLRRKCDRSVGKEVDGALYMAERWSAAENARNLRNKHINDGTAFPDDNPSSGVFELLDAIEHRSAG